MPCGIAERIPDAEIVSNDNAVAPCFFIKNSKSSAISLSVTPSLILPKTYSNAISPIFSASAIFLISHSSFISRGLFIRFCISTKSCPSFSFALIRLFSPTLIYDSSKPIFRLFLKIFFQNLLQYQSLQSLLLAHAPVLCIANL